jgi:hypothetical protein
MHTPSLPCIYLCVCVCSTEIKKKTWLASPEDVVGQAGAASQTVAGACSLPFSAKPALPSMRSKPLGPCRALSPQNSTQPCILL